MDDKLRLDVCSALDAAIGPVPPAGRFFASLPSARRRTRLHVARPWVAAVATAMLLAGLLAAPRILGGSRPTRATPPTAERTSPVVGGFGSQVTSTPAPSASQGNTSLAGGPGGGGQASGAQRAPSFYPDCKPDEVRASITTDRTGYTTGQVVHITMSVRNISLHPCWLPGGFALTIADTAGKGVYGEAAMSEADSAPSASPPAATQSFAIDWNQKSSDTRNAQVADGTYTASYQTDGDAATTTFTITGSGSEPPSPTPAPPTPTPPLVPPPLP